MRDVWVLGLHVLWYLCDRALSLDPTYFDILGKGENVRFGESMIVFPQRINENGEKYSSHRHFHKRSIRQKWDNSVLYYLDVNGRSYNLSLSYSTDFVLPGVVVQKYNDNHTWLEEDDSHTGLSCFYSGTVNGAVTSQAILSLCDGMTGMFSTGEEHFIIEPHLHSSNSSEHFNQSDSGVIPHLLYTVKHSQKHNASDSTCGIYNENYKHHRRKRESESDIEDLTLGSSDINSDNSDLTLYSPHNIHKRSVSHKNYVEVMVAADYHMYKYHGKNLEHYVLTLMSIVNSIYRSHTIGNFIHIVIVKIIIFHSEREGPKITQNAGETLKRFCRWQSRNNDDDNSKYHYDTAILLTRQDICRAPNKCDTLGLAELGTMCDRNRSCSIVEDNGISAAYTIAHELGHVFNLPHDDDSRCRRPSYDRDPKDKTYVMSATIDENTDPWSWSECSARLLTKFLDAGLGSCLHDQPRMKRYRKPIKRLQKKHAGSMTNANVQCELVYGKNYYHCPFLAMCHILWCTDNIQNGCRTQHMPMADGTKCGIGKWCMRGACVKRKLERKVKGGWGPWRPYGKCTRTCDGGIKKAYRECNNPTPQNGGRYCTGKRIKYRHCNIKPCPADSDDFRVQQCAEYNSQIRYFNITPGSRWIPKYDGIPEKDWCKLYCKADSSPSHFYMLNHKVIDGSKCRPDGNDICINGQCRRGGCDNKLGSSMKRDRCGICGGDNASCKTFSGMYNSVEYGYSNVSLIPVGATNIDIRQQGYSHVKEDENYLALLNSRNEYVLNGEFIISMYPHKIQVRGAVLEYTGSNTMEERINSTGTLGEDLMVQVLSVGGLNPPKIHYSYTLALKNDIVFIWLEDKAWTECNDICNGVRHRQIKCVRDQDYSQVSDLRCENKPKPHVESERCNPYCTVSWKVERDDCSTHCGAGFAQQYISCTLTTRYNTTIIDTAHCEKRTNEIGPRPRERVICYGKCMDAHWEYTTWTRCTASCNVGAQKRTATCVDSHGNKVSNDYCGSRESVVLERTCNTQPCAGWVSQDWTGCSVTCGHGSRHRKVTCIQGPIEVPDAKCNRGNKPTSKIECYMGTCPIWVEGEWGQCSVTCDKGIAIRKVECRSSSGQTLDDFHCDVTQRPYETSTCDLGVCPTTTARTTTSRVPTTTTELQLLWSVGSWTQCSTTCGEGIKQRYVTCMDGNGNVDNVFACGHLTKPAETEVCIQRPCGNWRSGDWTECSVTCSAGRQTRRIACILMDRQAVDDKQCNSNAKPETERACTMDDCKPEDFDIGIITKNDVIGISHWRIGPWSACSSSCGEGWQRRQVLCHDEKGSSIGCDEDQKPMERQSCDAGPCPRWTKSEWSQCSASCGDSMGIQERSVICQSATGQQISQESCDIFERPPDSRMCNNGPCSKRRVWQVGPWSPCSVTCGAGSCQREVLCVSEAGQVRPSNECQEAKPRNTKRCTMAHCPAWAHSKWSKCSMSCGMGIQHRVVECKMGQSATVPDKLCVGKKRPRTERKCDEKKCSDINWQAGNWSECSKDCGFGSKVREVYCVDIEDQQINSSLCDDKHKLKTKRRCSEFPCPFMWNTGPWSQCSKSCGAGQQQRRVVCHGVTKEGWILPGEVPYGCKTADKPEEVKTCNYGACESRYHWMTAPWGECSTRCGHGIERRQVQCVDPNGQKQKKRLCPLSHRPRGRQECYKGPCYASSCLQLKEQTSIRQDGSYKLFLQGRLIEIYCKNMKKPVPEEYLTLLAGDGENYAEVYPYRLKRQRTCPNNGTRQETCKKLCRSRPYRNAGKTSYSKIKIDIRTLKVQVADITFATSQKGKHIPFGSAGDCYSSEDCPQGGFSINLSGTGLIVSSNTTWASQGSKLSQKITRVQDGEVVQGRCGGICGWCSPKSGIQLEVLH